MAGIFLLLVFGPAAIGYWDTTAGFVLMAAIIAFAITRYWASGPPNWFQREPIVSGGVLILLTIDILTGVAAGRKADEETAHREAAQRQLEQEIQESAARTRAAEQRRVEAERLQREREAAIEARRTPSERALLAASILAGVDAGAMGLHERVCLARRQIAAIPAQSVHQRDVQAVIGALQRVERDALREERLSARDTRMVACCDGELSPSCTCERSSHRGCCSHHGGMCGCEPLPTEIVCEN